MENDSMKFSFEAPTHSEKPLAFSEMAKNLAASHQSFKRHEQLDGIRSQIVKSSQSNPIASLESLIKIYQDAFTLLNLPECSQWMLPQQNRAIVHFLQETRNKVFVSSECSKIIKRIGFFSVLDNILVNWFNFQVVYEVLVTLEKASFLSDDLETTQSIYEAIKALSVEISKKNYFGDVSGEVHIIEKMSNVLGNVFASSFFHFKQKTLKEAIIPLSKYLSFAFLSGKPSVSSAFFLLRNIVKDSQDWISGNSNEEKALVVLLQETQFPKMIKNALLQATSKAKSISEGNGSSRVSFEALWTLYFVSGSGLLEQIEGASEFIMGVLMNFVGGMIGPCPTGSLIPLIGSLANISADYSVNQKYFGPFLLSQIEKILVGQESLSPFVLREFFIILRNSALANREVCGFVLAQKGLEKTLDKSMESKYLAVCRVELKEVLTAMGKSHGCEFLSFLEKNFAFLIRMVFGDQPMF